MGKGAMWVGPLPAHQLLVCWVVVVGGRGRARRPACNHPTPSRPFAFHYASLSLSHLLACKVMVRATLAYPANRFKPTVFSNFVVFVKKGRSRPHKNGPAHITFDMPCNEACPTAIHAGQTSCCGLQSASPDNILSLISRRWRHLQPLIRLDRQSHFQR
jgi:hypothetical protein